MKSLNRSLFGALGAASILMAGMAVPANAAPAPASVVPNSVQVCQSGSVYSTTQSGRYIGNSGTRVYGKAGGNLSISSGTSTTVSGSLQTTVSAEAGAIFAKASASVGLTVGLSKTVSTTVGYSWTVPSSQPSGWIEMGAHGFQISWEKGHYNSPCTYVRDSTGNLLGATSNVEFSHS